MKSPVPTIGPDGSVVVKLPQLPKVHYYYFGRKIWQQHRGIVTAAAIILDAEKKTMRVAFAYCSPLDQFHRSTIYRPSKETGQDEPIAGGREIAAARLGVAAWPEEKLMFYDGTYTHSLLDGVIRIFNNSVPRKEKPQLWQNRMLLLASRDYYLTDTSNLSDLLQVMMTRMINPVYGAVSLPGFIER